MANQFSLSLALSLGMLALGCAGDRARAAPQTVVLPSGGEEPAPVASAPPRSPPREVRWERGTPPSTEDRARAEALFQEARTLMQNGDYAAACERFADSMELDPAVGTLLNMASCAERAGNVGQACEWYRAARDMARQKAQAERERFVESRLKTLGCS